MHLFEAAWRSNVIFVGQVSGQIVGQDFGQTEQQKQQRGRKQ